MLSHIDLNSALVVAPISMAKIEGRQSARDTMSLFTDILLPYAPDDGGSSDVAIVTTEGLYMNDSAHSAFELREKLWEKADHFRRHFEKRLAVVQKDCPRILPTAYEVETFDATRARASHDFRQLFGFLKNESTINHAYREKAVADLSLMGQPERPDKLAFLNEEFVWGWLLYKGRIPLREHGSLRRHKEGQTIICYPGPLMSSQIEAYRLLSQATGPLPLGRCLYVDTEARQDVDISLTIATLDTTAPLCKRVPQLPLTAKARGTALSRA